MPRLFFVEPTDINDLDQFQLTKLLKMLLQLEARASGIAESAVEVALNILVPDGGEDGRVKWDGHLTSTSYIPHRFTQFQIKATDMGPANCARELVSASGTIKPMVDDALLNSAVYVLFTRQTQNSQQKEKNISAMREQLMAQGKSYALSCRLEIYDAGKISGWVNKYLSAIVALLNWVRRPLERGLKTWTEWGKHPEYESFPFVPDEARSNAISSLRQLLSKPRQCARCTGLSGLGKTRLAFEVFRDSDPHDDLSERVVYVDSRSINNISGLVTDWIHCQIEGILVVDNCDIELHAQLRSEVRRTDSRLSLLTLDYTLGKDNETETVHLKQMADESIKTMLTPVYGDKINDLDRIVTFAQGFPQMAVLLAKSRLENEPEMGRLTDENLANELLWGDGQPNARGQKILQGCALFDKFGLDDEVSNEYEFIADHVLVVDRDEFYECVKTFEERGLIDRRGRYAQVVPKPLAIRLAAEWWRKTRPERKTSLIQSDMPPALAESFCDQVKMLDFLPEVKKLAGELCGTTGPFGQAEVILSERGSQLFRAFVGVDPQATSSSLSRALTAMSPTELVGVEGTVRRNIIRALEKLCFHQDCFTESAWSLLHLVAAENETWSNNASGIFKQLFRTFLSGTEATPTQRLQLIDRALSQSVFKPYGVKVLEEVISPRSGMRVVGAEYQGIGEPLKEWRPTVWQDAFDYWSQGLRRLVELIVVKDDYARVAKQAIASNLRGLVSYGRIIELDEAIRKIVASDGALWPEAVDNIQTIIEFDSERMPPEGQQILADWMQILTPSNLSDRLVLLVSHAPYNQKIDEPTRSLIDVAAKHARELAQEFALDFSLLVPHVEELSMGLQRQSHLFGKFLVMYAKSWEPLLSRATEIIAENRGDNPSFMLGLLSGIFDVSPDDWASVVNDLYKNQQLWKHFASIVATGRVSETHLIKLVDLIESSSMNASTVLVLSSGKPLDHLPLQVVTNFALTLSTLSSHACWYALDVLTMYCHGADERLTQARPALKKIVLKAAFSSVADGPQLGMYQWGLVVNRILDDLAETDFALELAQSLLQQQFERIDFSDRVHYIGPAISKLFANFGEIVWPLFAAVIKDSTPLQEHLLSELLSSGINYEKHVPSILANLPENVLREWCIAEPTRGPEFVARITDVFSAEDEDVLISSRAKFLLDEFGDNDRVLSALSANFSTFGWTGSIVPYYKREKLAIATLSGHTKASVRAWVAKRTAYLDKMIERETQRDQEGEWGVY